MVYADLHNHTWRSDGVTNNIAEVAKRSNIGAVAVTDHHNIKYDVCQPLETINGVDVISGIELSVTHEESNQELDIIGYGAKPYDKLERHIVETNGFLNKKFEGHIQIEKSKAFWSNFNKDNILSFEEGAELLDDTCNFVSLAHPYRYNKPEEALEAAKKLDGVECEYGYGFDLPENRLDTMYADKHDLTITGGSDSHAPYGVGKYGLSENQYKEFLINSGLITYSDKFSTT